MGPALARLGRPQPLHLAPARNLRSLMLATNSKVDWLGSFVI